MDHQLDVYPEPRNETPLFINEPWLTDKYLYKWGSKERGPEDQEDNIRVYVPLDLNREAILRRLQLVIEHYGESNEGNECGFNTDVDVLVEQIAIYDRIWYIRTMEESDRISNKQHSAKAISLVKEFVSLLESIPDGCAELFPYEIIERLKQEYEV